MTPSITSYIETTSITPSIASTLGSSSMTPSTTSSLGSSSMIPSITSSLGSSSMTPSITSSLGSSSMIPSITSSLGSSSMTPSITSSLGSSSLTPSITSSLGSSSLTPSITSSLGSSSMTPYVTSSLGSSSMTPSITSYIETTSITPSITSTLGSSSMTPSITSSLGSSSMTPSITSSLGSSSMTPSITSSLGSSSMMPSITSSLGSSTMTPSITSALGTSSMTPSITSYIETTSITPSIASTLGSSSMTPSTTSSLGSSSMIPSITSSLGSSSMTPSITSYTETTSNTPSITSTLGSSLMIPSITSSLSTSSMTPSITSAIETTSTTPSVMSSTEATSIVQTYTYTIQSTSYSPAISTAETTSLASSSPIVMTTATSTDPMTTPITSTATVVEPTTELSSTPSMTTTASSSLMTTPVSTTLIEPTMTPDTTTPTMEPTTPPIETTMQTTTATAVPFIPLYFENGIATRERMFQPNSLDYRTVYIRLGLPIGSNELYYYLTVTTTGMIHFSKRPPTSLALAKYTNPSRFTELDRFSSQIDPAVAVFGAPVDTSVGSPSLYYEVFESSTDVEFFSALRDRLRSLDARPWGIENNDVIDTLTTAVLVTWENFQPPDTVPGQETVTYQAIVFTNGARTGVLMLYEIGSFNWIELTKEVEVVIGFNAKYTRSNRFSAEFKSESYRPDLNIGSISGTEGVLIYRLDDNPSTFVNSAQFCDNWYQEDIETLFPALPIRLQLADDCPCSIFQSFFDRRYTRCIEGSFFCRQSRRSFFGGAHRCYYFLPLLPGNSFSDPWRTTNYEAYRYHSFELWFERDFLPRFHCCHQGAGPEFCGMYQERRPTSTCSRYRPPRRSWFWGDPHIRTLDGRGYTFNGLGEYSMLEYTNNDSFVLQARTGKAFNNSEPVDTGTVFTGFAATQGITVVEFSLNDNRTAMRILINKTEEITDFTTLEGDGYDSADSTFSLTLENNTDTLVRVTALFLVGELPDTSFTVTFTNEVLDVLVSVPSEYNDLGIGRGLLGNINGNSSDEFLLRNGTTLEDSLATNLTDKDIYPFGQSWQLTEAESLFEYGDRDWSYYNPSNYTPIFLSDLLAEDPERTAAARATCGDDESCLFDYLAVNPELGQMSMETGNAFQEDLDNLENFPPNITMITDTGNVLQEDGRVIYAQVNQTIQLSFTAEDQNNGDIVTFKFGEVYPEGANITADGDFQWTPMDFDISRLEVVASDQRGAESTVLFRVKICSCFNDGECDYQSLAEGQNFTGFGYGVVTCNCSNGWSGDQCDEDFNSCAGNPCYQGVLCVDSPPMESTDFTCGDCPPGRVGDGVTCSDVNECLSNTTNDCEQNCHNILDGYYCSCDDGFTLSLDERSCIDNAGCTPAAMNNTGSSNCTCDPGYEFLNGSCSDFDECSNDVDECPDTSTCINTDGDYFCSCIAGYDAINETKSCADIDECDTGEHNCIPMLNRQCMNTIGNFACVCALNFAEMSGTCVAATTFSIELRFDFINGMAITYYSDTTQNRDRLADEVLDQLNGTSIFGDGLLVGVLVTNYTLVELVDQEYGLVEFRIDTFNPNLTATDIQSAFTASLPLDRIFGSSNRILEPDINECIEFTGVCSNGNCTNTEGSYFCTCNQGFQGTGTDQCEDINECLSGAHACQEICINTDGNYSCACSDGYELDSGGLNCSDINECSGNTSVCENGICTNLEGSFNCTCNPGYELANDNVTCIDIDECLLELHECQEMCINNDGNYSCACSDGNELDSEGFNCSVSPTSTTMDPIDTTTVTSDTTVVTSDTTSLPTDTTSVMSDNPTITTDTTSVTSDNPTITTDTTSVTSDNPTITTDTTAVTSDTTSLTTDATPVTSDTTSIITSTTMETVATSQFDVVIFVVISFNATYQSALADPTSTAFTTLATALCDQLVAYYMTLTNRDITCVVLGFTSGSVVANVDLTISANNSSEAEDIRSNAVNVTAVDIGSFQVGNETYSPMTVNSNVTIQERQPDISTISSTMGMETNQIIESTTTKTTTTTTALVVRLVRLSLRVTRLNDVILEYNTSLSDSTTPYFQYLANIFCNAVREYIEVRYDALQSYTCDVLTFVEGSVIGNMQIEVGAPTTAEATAIEQAITDIATMNQLLTFGSTTLSVMLPTDSPGLSGGAIVGIAIGAVSGAILIIICISFLLMHTSRQDAAKRAFDEAYHSKYNGDSPVFFGDDPYDDASSYYSIDRREFAVGRAVQRLTRDRERGGMNRDFRTPYMVDGEDNEGYIERNPIYC
ncbi:mucin-4-like [Lytechinus variegatus]|uniref:mucin-4-like n=1 Tax=Lytechinus variegatus TaxID=7654 RepID=UPI001BB1E754|nr:mucin-4-like [Lytechinus variegatus]